MDEIQAADVLSKVTIKCELTLREVITAQQSCELVASMKELPDVIIRAAEIASARFALIEKLTMEKLP